MSCFYAKQFFASFSLISSLVILVRLLAINQTSLILGYQICVLRIKVSLWIFHESPRIIGGYFLRFERLLFCKLKLAHNISFGCTIRCQESFSHCLFNSFFCCSRFSYGITEFIPNSLLSCWNWLGYIEIGSVIAIVSLQASQVECWLDKSVINTLPFVRVVVCILGCRVLVKQMDWCHWLLIERLDSNN